MDDRPHTRPLRRIIRQSDRARYERSATYRRARSREDRRALLLMCAVTFLAGAVALAILGAAAPMPS